MLVWLCTVFALLNDPYHSLPGYYLLRTAIANMPVSVVPAASPLHPYNCHHSFSTHLPCTTTDFLPANAPCSATALNLNHALPFATADRAARLHPTCCHRLIAITQRRPNGAASCPTMLAGGCVWMMQFLVEPLRLPPLPSPRLAHLHYSAYLLRARP